MKMLSYKGYRAFHGRMLVQLAPDVKDLPPFIEGPCDWFYDPDKQMWCSDQHSYKETVCTPLFDGWKEELKTS